MNLLEIIADVLGYFFVGATRPDTDRSIVGKSALEEDLARFWQRLGLAIVLAGCAAALYVSVVRPHLTSPESAAHEGA